MVAWWWLLVAGVGGIIVGAAALYALSAFFGAAFVRGTAAWNR